MNARSQNVWTILLVTSILVAGLSMLNGCKKSEPVPPPQTATGTGNAAAVTEQAATTAAAATEQTVCPVMGGAINKNIFTEYKGKKVYFCMESCKTAFEKDPEKYIAKLPQFAK